jgi:hypothetical protein
LAVKLRQDSIYTKKPDHHVMREISKEVNSIPLPNIPETPHILLPPPEHALIRNNFQIFSEELFDFFNNPDKVKEKATGLEEEFGVGKRHTMLGLKRRDEHKPNLIPSKKRIRLSQNAQIEETKKQNHHHASNGNKHKQKPTQQHQEPAKNKKMSRDEEEGSESMDQFGVDNDNDEENERNNYGRRIPEDSEDDGEFNYNYGDMNFP